MIGRFHPTTHFMEEHGIDVKEKRLFENDSKSNIKGEGMLNFLMYTIR